MMMKSAMARVMMRKRSGVPVHLASAMTKSMYSKMSGGCPTPVKASDMSGTVAGRVTREPVASCMSRAMDSEMSRGYAVPMNACALSMKTSGMSGTPAVHGTRERMAPTVRMGSPSSTATASTAASIALDGRD